MGLAQPGSAVDQQRVVHRARACRDLQTRGARLRIRSALNEGAERVPRIEPALDERGEVLGLGRGRRRCGRGRGSRLAGSADREADQHVVLHQTGNDTLYFAQEFAAHPLHHQAIGSQQGHLILGLHHPQRPDPGADLLVRQLGFELYQALTPQILV
jgi:hypothetical protein